MAGAGRSGTRDLIAEIRREGYRFRFPQAVRLLARSHSERPNSEHTGHERGEAAVPRSVRFRTPATLSFPASEILQALDRGEENARELDLIIGFMGLTGPSGALPTHYTELLIERRNFHRDSSAHAFFDLFSHRAVSLFYQAWRKYRFYLPYEAGERDGFSRNLLDLVGVGLGGLRQRLQQQSGGVPDIFLTHFAGLLSQRPLAGENLVALLRGYFGVEVKLEQFVGQWQSIPVEEQTRLGFNACALGQSAVAGERAWDRQNKIRLTIGPLDHKQFSDFLPGKPGAAALTELVKFCVGHALACDVTLVLKKESVPAPALSKDAVAPLRLGYNCWTRTRPLQQDACDMAYALLA